MILINTSNDHLKFSGNHVTGIPYDMKLPLLSIDSYLNEFMDHYSSTLDLDGLEILLHIRSICMDTLNTLTKVSEYDSNYPYPLAKEKELIAYFKNKDMTLLSYFKDILDNIYDSLSDDMIKANLVSKQLYQTMITEMYQEFTWLQHYLPPSSFEKMDYYIDGDIWAFKKFYLRKITYLFDFIVSLSLQVSDTTFNDLISYILHHPDNDLKLKVISPIFYMNHTYLSNTFHTKTGLHYSDYITKIKMTRAKYLFQNTDLKIYEISYQLGYKDINYFSRQFKKHYGLNPTEFRCNNFSDYQI